MSCEDIYEHDENLNTIICIGKISMKTHFKI